MLCLPIEHCTSYFNQEIECLINEANEKAANIQNASNGFETADM